jgi:chemotaxis response regulator CheB
MRTAEPVVSTRVDVALVLAEVVCRLRHAGVLVAADRAAMAEAHDGMARVLSALGVPVEAGPLTEADYHLLRCAAARS